MIDLHTHTLFSDGELLPSEIVRRAVVNGYTAIALTDHADVSNIDFIIPRIVIAARELNLAPAGIKQGAAQGIKVIPGIELTHCPPQRIKGLVEKARELGAKLVVVHGETPVEPVQEGTNRTAIESRADILAHPGFIKEEDVKLAKELGVYLEITARKGHSIANGYVAKMAKRCGAHLVLNSDSHSPSDLLNSSMAGIVAKGAGLEADDIIKMERNANDIVENIFCKTQGY